MTTCALFDALPSRHAVLGLTCGSALALYALLYAARVCAGRATRPTLVFAFDLAKIALAQAGGLALFEYLAAAGRVVPAAHAAELDALSWWLPHALFRESYAYVVALVGAALLTALLALVGERCGASKVTSALHQLGRYAPDESDTEQLLGGADRARGGGGPLLSWFFAQLVLWAGCVAGGYAAAALVLPTLLGLAGDKSPEWLLARAIAQLGWPCARKQLLFALALRIAFELALVAAVDRATSYGGGPRRREPSGGEGGELKAGTRVQALWKYTAKYDDELSFEAGDTILIDGAVDGEEYWFRGTLGGRSGLIPANYVTDTGRG